ncbi:syntaxin-11-like [Polymixia lowei]
MRDRLRHLQTLNELGAAGPSDCEAFATLEPEDPSEQQASAGTSNHDPDLDGVLQQAQQIRLEIQQIQHGITDLRDINHRALNSSSHPGATKWDSNAIGADIKSRGEAALRRLRGMKALGGELEAQRGSADPVARIARTQYQCLSSALQEVMLGYNEAEMTHREDCKRHIQRQMEIVGRDVTKEELEGMMESGQWNVFSVQAEGKTARSALVQIESRQRELQELETRIQGIQELFLDVAVLTEEQGAIVDNIQTNVQNTEATIQDAAAHLEKAITYDKNNPFKKLFCCCFPCFNR